MKLLVLTLRSIFSTRNLVFLVVFILFHIFILWATSIDIAEGKRVEPATILSLYHKILFIWFIYLISEEILSDFFRIQVGNGLDRITAFKKVELHVLLISILFSFLVLVTFKSYEILDIYLIQPQNKIYLIVVSMLIIGSSCQVMVFLFKQKVLLIIISYFIIYNLDISTSRIFPQYFDIISFSPLPLSISLDLFVKDLGIEKLDYLIIGLAWVAVLSWFSFRFLLVKNFTK